MTTAMLLLLLAQTPAAPQRGATVFAQTCSVGYCHGSGGSVGRAPRLAGRAFDRGYLVKVSSAGIPGTGMPGFGDRIPPADLNAVVDFVMSLSGGAAPPPPPGAMPNFAVVAPDHGPPDVRRGRTLFFDPVRGTRCSTCHALEGRGIPIGPNLAVTRPAGAAAIRNAKADSVKTATVDGDRFPALMVEQKPDEIRIYDLTAPPPVLRTLAPRAVRWSGDAAWKHAAAVANYTDAEMDAVAAYLRWLAAR